VDGTATAALLLESDTVVSDPIAAASETVTSNVPAPGTVAGLADTDVSDAATWDVGGGAGVGDVLGDVGDGVLLHPWAMSSVKTARPVLRRLCAQRRCIGGGGLFHYSEAK